MRNWLSKTLVFLEKSPHKTLWAVIAASVFLRLLAALYLGNEVVELPGTFDQISYHNLALRVLGGHGFSFGEVWWPITPADAPTAHWSFLYTLYLVAVYSLFGPQPIMARLIQAVIVGFLHPLIVYHIGKKLFGSLEGLIAAAVTAFYVYFIYYSGALMTEPFYITAILGGFLLAFQIVAKSRDRLVIASLGLGAVLAVTILLRQLYLLIIPFILLWLIWAFYQRSKALPITTLVLVALLVAMLILPFSLYNYSRFGRFVLLNTNSGYAFFWGNHPIYGSTFVPILTPEMGSYQDLIPPEVRHLDEAALDQELLKRGLQFVFDDPGRYVLLSLSRIPAYFTFWPSPESGLISNISRVGSFGLFLPFMLLGLALSFWRRIKQNKTKFLDFLASDEALLFLFMLIYTAIHLLTWALVRYRLPVDAVLVIYASVGLVFLARKFSGFVVNRVDQSFVGSGESYERN